MDTTESRSVTGLADDQARSREILFTKRSAEAEEIIGKIPSGFVQYGAVVIMLCILMMLCIGALLKNPVYVSFQALILPSDGNVNLMCPRVAKISHVYVNDGEHVHKGKPLAALESSVLLSDLDRLQTLVCAIDSALELNKAVDNVSATSHLQIGEFQSDYRDLQIAVHYFKKYPERLETHQDLRNKAKQLISRIDQWHDLNLIKSTDSGCVLFSKAVKLNRLIEKDEILFTVQRTSQPVSRKALGYIAVNDLSKIKPGQEVLMQPFDYSQTNSETLKGTVEHIGLASVNGYHPVTISLPRVQLISHDHKLPENVQLQTKANVLVSEQTYLQSLFN